MQKWSKSYLRNPQRGIQFMIIYSTTRVIQLISDDCDLGLKMAAVVRDVILFELLDMVMEEVYCSGDIMQYVLA